MGLNASLTETKTSTLEARRDARTPTVTSVGSNDGTMHHPPGGPDPTDRAATSNSVMICTGAMSSIANCISRARFPTAEWQQSTASMGNGGNATVIAGVSQWQQPFADMIAYPINTEGQGARSCCDGMDAYGFPWCAFGRAPDVETIENEFPMVIPFSQHWPDSGGHGRYRGGCGTAQFWASFRLHPCPHDGRASSPPPPAKAAS